MTARTVIADAIAVRRHYSARCGMTTRQLGPLTDALLIIGAVALSRAPRDPVWERIP
jgi:hypothetical protein